MKATTRSIIVIISAIESAVREKAVPYAKLDTCFPIEYAKTKQKHGAQRVE